MIAYLKINLHLVADNDNNSITGLNTKCGMNEM